MNGFRRAVLAEMDAAHEMTDGSTPDHIIVSEAIWKDMKQNRRFEKLKDPDSPKRRTGESVGYIGMRVWPSGALDDRAKFALLLSEEAFKQMFDRPEDL